MELGDLLTELRENILHDRSDRIAGDPDQLWSDATLVRYIDEAQRRFARKALVIRDNFSADATKITLVAGQTEYKLHDSVLAVLSAKYDTDTGDLVRVGHAYLGAYQLPMDAYYDPSQYAYMSPGRPLAFSTDETISEDDYASVSAPTIRVYPAPSADVAGKLIRLRIIRLPIERLTDKNLKAVPEVPETHHLEMLDWAAYLALRIVDRDGEDAARAKEFANTFEAHVVEARREVFRKIFVPMRFNFGRNGFSWES